MLSIMYNSLETSGRLMEFDGGDGKLRVHYSDRLVALLREVRQLNALGFSLPVKITTTAQTAHKFYRHGVVLKQVSPVLHGAGNDAISVSLFFLLASLAGRWLISTTP